MVNTKTATTASIMLMPSPCKPSSSSTSKAVMMIAHVIGMWNNRFRATALPSDSARSVMPRWRFPSRSSWASGVHFGYQSRQHWARSLPVATPEPGRDHLEEDRHETGQAHHPQQPVLELRPARQVRAPVARVHVADADQDRRPCKRPPTAPEPGVLARHLHRAVHVRERRGVLRHGAGRPAPQAGPWARL